MAQVPSISSGLLSGGAGGAGFSGLGGATQTLGARAGSSVVSGTGRAAGAGASFIYDKADGEGRAARQGAKHATEGFSTGGRQFGRQRQTNAYLRGHAATKAVKRESDAKNKTANWRD